MVIFRVAPPVLISVTVCVAVDPTCVSGKVRLDGDRDTAAGVSPVPLSVTDCGLPLKESSVMVKAPLRTPATVGVKVMLITQLALGANVPPQLLL